MENSIDVTKMDKRIIELKISRGEMRLDALKDNLAALPDLSDNAVDIVAEMKRK